MPRLCCDLTDNLTDDWLSAKTDVKLVFMKKKTADFLALELILITMTHQHYLNMLFLIDSYLYVTVASDVAATPCCNSIIRQYF